MTTKTIRFNAEEWTKIEKMLNERDISFSDLVKEKLFSQEEKNTSSNSNLILSDHLKEVEKFLMDQNSKTLEFLNIKIKDLERKIELITERTTYAFFKTIAEGKEAIQRLTINDFEIGDIIISHQKIINTILDINKEKEEFIITPFPLFRLQDTRKRSLAYLKEKVNWLVRIDKTKKI